MFIIINVFSLSLNMRFFFINVYNVFFIFLLCLRIEESELGSFELMKLLAIPRSRLGPFVHFHRGIKAAQDLASWLLVLGILFTGIEIDDWNLIRWNLDQAFLGSILGKDSVLHLLGEEV